MEHITIRAKVIRDFVYPTLLCLLSKKLLIRPNVSLETQITIKSVPFDYFLKRFK